MKKKIAFFDFDGTITKKDTLIEFIRFYKGSAKLILGFLLNSPYLIAYKLKIIQNQQAKERILTYFFGNMKAQDFESLCLAFSAQNIPALIRPGALDEFKKLKAQQVEIVIVSASPENWIQPWVDINNFVLIATILEVRGDLLTGCIKGKNCHGTEKVKRIKSAYHLEDYDQIFAYGDTKGDEPMLALSHFPVMKPFR